MKQVQGNDGDSDRLPHIWIGRADREVHKRSGDDDSGRSEVEHSFRAASNFLKLLFLILKCCGDIRGINSIRFETFGILKFIVVKYFYIKPMDIWISKNGYSEFRYNEIRL